VAQTVNEQQQAGEHDAVFIGNGAASGGGLVQIGRWRFCSDEETSFLNQPASLDHHQGSGQK
jgi:hypothetical protein